jgi:hypothetical protein
MERLKRYKWEIVAGVLWSGMLWYHAPAIWAFWKYLTVHPLAYLLVFYANFQLYGTYKSAKDRGEEIPPEAKIMLFPFFVNGFFMDLGWRLVPGTLMFGFDWPTRDGGIPLFTKQLKRWKLDPAWRGAIARWHKKMLDWGEPGEHV